VTNIFIFDQNFYFWPKFLFFTKNFIFDFLFLFLNSISIFDANFNWWAKFWFLRSIFTEFWITKWWRFKKFKSGKEMGLENCKSFPFYCGCERGKNVILTTLIKKILTYFSWFFSPFFCKNLFLILSTRNIIINVVFAKKN